MSPALGGRLEGPPVIRRVFLSLAIEMCAVSIVPSLSLVPPPPPRALGPELQCLTVEPFCYCCRGRLSSVAPWVLTLL